MRNLKRQRAVGEKLRRINLFAVLLVIIILPFRSISEKLYVFFPSIFKAVRVEAKLKTHFSGNEVRVFGNLRDFKAVVESDVPQLIITKQEVVAQLKQYKVVLRGQRAGAITEPYFLVSTDKALKINELGDKVIGILDFLGRKQTTEFADDLLGVKPQKLNRVKKIMDLASLMSLAMVDGIVVSQGHYTYIRQQSQLNFKDVQCRKSLVIAVCAAQEKENSSMMKQVKTLPDDLMMLLGVESWR